MAARKMIQYIWILVASSFGNVIYLNRFPVGAGNRFFFYKFPMIPGSTFRTYPVRWCYENSTGGNHEKKTSYTPADIHSDPDTEKYIGADPLWREQSDDGSDGTDRQRSSDPYSGSIFLRLPISVPIMGQNDNRHLSIRLYICKTK